MKLEKRKKDSEAKKVDDQCEEMEVGKWKDKHIGQKEEQKTGDILKLLLEQQKMEAPLVQQQCAPEPEPASQSVW